MVAHNRALIAKAQIAKDISRETTEIVLKHSNRARAALAVAIIVEGCSLPRQAAERLLVTAIQMQAQELDMYDFVANLGHIQANLPRHDYAVASAHLGRLVAQLTKLLPPRSLS
jgi:hypothetical protein